MIVRATRRAALLVSLIMPWHPVVSAEPLTLSQALTTLAKAKAKAEDAVHVVKLYASDDPAVQIEAIRDYSHARAGFNGFIEGLMTERNLDASAARVAYSDELDQAIQLQKNFLTFVQKNVVEVQSQHGKALINDVLKGVGSVLEGLSALGHSAVDVHKEWTRQSDARRNEVRVQLEKLKWQQFSKVE